MQRSCLLILVAAALVAIVRGTSARRPASLGAAYAAAYATPYAAAYTVPLSAAYASQRLDVYNNYNAALLTPLGGRLVAAAFAPAAARLVALPTAYIA